MRLLLTQRVPEPFAQFNQPVLLTLLHADCRGEETMWDVFMDQFEVLATQAPVMLVAGNHERDFPDSGDRYGTNIDSGTLHAHTVCVPYALRCLLAGEANVMPNSKACCLCSDKACILYVLHEKQASTNAMSFLWRVTCL